MSFSTVGTGRISFCHLVEEVFFVQFLKKAAVDELLRFGALRLRQLGSRFYWRNLNRTTPVAFRVYPNVRR